MSFDLNSPNPDLGKILQSTGKPFIASESAQRAAEMASVQEVFKDRFITCMNALAKLTTAEQISIITTLRFISEVVMVEQKSMGTNETAKQFEMLLNMCNLATSKEMRTETARHYIETLLPALDGDMEGMLKRAENLIKSAKRIVGDAKSN